MRKVVFVSVAMVCTAVMFPILRPDASESRPVSHEKWDALVKKLVKPDGKVDYKGFIKDSLQLNAYLDLLSKNHPNPQHWSTREQLAYWINAYNAFTVRLIIRNYPVQSIKDIKKGIPFVNSVWDIRFIRIEDRIYDLNNIEHSILRKEFEEPRIHFALNCASRSCPDLRPEAFTADRLDAQLSDQAKKFLADPAKNEIQPDRIRISKIFSWFQSDFTRKSSLIAYLNQYAPLRISAHAKVDYLEYDWSLNE